MKDTVLITGASTGIGYELAKRFAADGNDMVLVARNRQRLRQVAEELQQLYDVPVRIIVQDLSSPAAAQKIYDALADDNLRIDSLVNNAGYGAGGYFHQRDLAGDLDMMQVNMNCVVALCKLFLPDMLQRGRGRILNVASTAAFQPGPLMAVYYASKAFLLSFTLALASEYQDKGITVTAFCPGPTKSEFQSRAGINNSRLVRFNLMPYMDVARAARAGYQGFVAGRRLVIPGFMNKLGVFSTRILPRRILMAIIKALHQTS
ncbi:SDR family oxidoreductase [candidate division KSB1 bacterium]|nr:SDR family oxidoreductase [candidate division KSB1 bacterium]